MPTNPMLSLLNPQASAAPTAAAPSSPDISGAVGLYKAYQAARNPIAALEQMTQSNPILAQLRQAQQGAVPVIQTGCTPFGNIFFGGNQQ